MNRRTLLGLFPCVAATVVLSACGTSVTPAQVAADIQTEATGLKAAVGALPAGLVTPTVMAGINTAVADLSAVAMAVSGTDAPTSSMITRVEQDVEAVISALDGLVPPQIQVYLTAASVLLPVIVAGVRTAFPTLGAAPLPKAVLVSAARDPAMTPAKARAVLLHK